MHNSQRIFDTVLSLFLRRGFSVLSMVQMTCRQDDKCCEYYEAGDYYKCLFHVVNIELFSQTEKFILR